MKLKRIVYSVLVIIWMITIFNFSNQISDESSNTSGKTIEIIINVLTSKGSLSEQEKLDLVNKLQPFVRKLAHFCIYMIGGILAFSLFNTFNLNEKHKIIYSLAFCGAYAITDEIHQYFVPGRSSELRDVCIDVAGVILGLVITISFAKIKGKKQCVLK